MDYKKACLTFGENEIRWEDFLFWKIVAPFSSTIYRINLNANGLFH